MTYLLREATSIRVEKAKVEEQVHFEPPIHTLPRITDLQEACQRIHDWVLEADGDDLSLLLEALQIQVHVETRHGELKGIIPEYAPRKSNADVCSMVINFCPNGMFVSGETSRWYG